MENNKPVDTNVIAKDLGVTGFSPLANFLKLHIVNALSDRVGDDPKLWNAEGIEQVERLADRHGFDPGTDELVYDKVNPPMDYYRNGINQDVKDEAAKRVLANTGEPDLVQKAANHDKVDQANLQTSPEVLQAANWHRFQDPAQG